MLTPVRSARDSERRSTTPFGKTSLLPLPVVRPEPTRIAVLLNGNARRVTDRFARRVERIVGSDHVFYSRSLEEAEALSREIVQRGYGTVVCGGGDGTLARAVNLVQRYVAEANQWRMERYLRFGEVQNLLDSPRFAFLRLGTGNAIGGVIGAGKPLDDLERIIAYAPGRTHSINLIESPNSEGNNERFFFGGLGYDSMLLNDYNALKQATHNPFLKVLMQNVTGYFAALFARTLPRLLANPQRIDARVTNRGRAYYIDPRRGDAAVEVEAGTTLFEGRATIISAGTMPFFGYGFRMFPFASMMPGMMHLRVATIGPLNVLGNLPSIWKGSYRNEERILDFLVEDAHIDLAQPFPFQHSGDAQGMRTEWSMRVAPDKLRLVDSYPPRRLS